jgi:hypothetical protein
MTGMDQGAITVWTTGLAVVGALVGALGGAAIQSRSMRRQVERQERANMRHWLLGQRQVAYTNLLERYESVRDSLNTIIAAQAKSDWAEKADHRELWSAANAALRSLELAATTVAVVGPARMEELARSVHEAALAQANAFRAPETEFGGRVMLFGPASDELARGLSRFVESARSILAGFDD